MNNIYVGDFETTYQNNIARVWLSAIVNIYNLDEIYYPLNIDDFFDKLYDISPNIIFFHNLKFDGMYILDYLLRNNYKYTDNKKLGINEFNCLISDDGIFYSINICNPKNNKKIQIWDSLKIYNFSVSEIAKIFKMDTLKGDIDYTKVRDIDYVPDENEYKYVKHDVLIVAKAIKTFIEQGYDKMTIASNAMKKFKSYYSKKEFEYMFPSLTIDEDNFCRKAYKGGFTYLNPKFQEKDIRCGVVYDMNSMYPYTLYYKPMPIGKPKYFIGKPPKDKLFIIKIHCDKFTVKNDYIPTIQLKNSLAFVPTEYIKEASDIDLILTSIDYKLFLEHYDVENCDEIEGYYFEQCDELFRDYIDEYMKIKMTTKGGERQIAKLFLNGLYGKFGTRIDKIKKIPYYDKEKNIVMFKLSQPEMSFSQYIPIAAFVTSYARDNIIRNAQMCYDRFIYCDTDSLHLKGFDIPNIPIDDVKLGYYKRESSFNRGYYIRSKTYIENSRKIIKNKYRLKIKDRELKLDCITHEVDVKCCGMPKNIAKTKVNFDNFKMGNSFSGKLRPVTVTGGVVLEETDFTIKNQKTIDKRKML